MAVNQIICGDCGEVIAKLPRATMVFADPPDNLGLKYVGFKDALPDKAYLSVVAEALWKAMVNSSIVWFSIYHKWLPYILSEYIRWKNRGREGWSYKLFIWRFTFGQHRDKDCGNGFRPIIRLVRNDAAHHPVFYPDAIREPSKRQTLYHDKRANPAGRVPDDVWDFSRVCGTFKERRQWHPTQHPEALIERIIKFSTAEGDTVIDMFAGTGTVNRVCRRLNRNCYGIEISPTYCDKIRAANDKSNS